MDIVDELMTPGCPQCAVKHLSAALFHVADGNLKPEDVTLAHPTTVHIAIAAINLAEVRAGYLSHLWYAVGALVRAEELAAQVGVGDAGRVARETRLMLEERGVEAVVDALRNIATSIWLSHADWVMAHYAEAMRELPAMQAAMQMDDLIGSIERVRAEFFPDTSAPAAATAEGGGESEMAKKTAKKALAFLKKEDPKAKQAACKGGKCKGKKCK